MSARQQITNEQCWVLTGNRSGMTWHCSRVQPTEGSTNQVEFSHDWVLQRNEDVGDVVGFYHTHPSGFLDPSEKDVQTMQAWTGCFGRPLLCLIGFEERIEGFIFFDDECSGWRLLSVKREEDCLIISDPRLLKC